MSQKSKLCSWIRRTRVSIVLFVLTASAGLFAQQPWEGAPLAADPKALLQAASAIPKEKNADAVVLMDNVTIAVDEAGRAKREYRLVYRVDTPNGVEHWAAVSYRYRPWHQSRPVIKARVITPDGVAHELDTKTLNDVAVQDHSQNVYSDEHEYEGPLPAVVVGSVVEEHTVLDDTAPFFEGSWSTRVYVGRSVPVLHSIITIDTPSSNPLRYVTRLLPDLKVTKSEANGRSKVVFEQARVEWGDYQSLLPPEVPRWPYVAMTTANSWQELASRYMKRTEPQIRPDEVKALVAGIKGTPDQVLAAILAKVHSNARYTGVEFGEAAIIPQPPAETLKRKYGDCKDKAALLVSMLRAAGVPANLALLNAGDDQDVDAEIPGMTWFDHAIAFIPSRNLFIDATAEYSRFAELPSGDQGRLALIIAEDTKELKRTAELPSSTNGKIERRDMVLSEHGPAKVVESTSWFGPNEGSLRSSYDGQSKEERKNLENYVKYMYLADGLTKYEHSDPVDLSKPFTLRLEMAKARRGFTDLDSSVAAIRVMDLVDQQLPNEILDEEKKEGEDTPAEQKKKPRTDDWYLNTASVAEWDYKITAPPGYSVRGLPESKTTKLGPAVLTEEYKSSADGVVDAKIRFDSVKRRYTIAEVKELREAWKQFQNHGVATVNFDLNGAKLLQQGKIKEGLSDLRKLAASHPNEGLHRAQLAQALLAASLGDMARTEAEQAVKLDPKSDVAYGTLGYVLLHDSVGRQFNKGWDMEGAIAAYRKAKELDPKNYQYRYNLALAMEYDADGEQYGTGAHLKDAVEEYKELRKLEDVNVENINERLAYAMAYAGQYKELRQELTNLGDKPVFDVMRVISTTALDGIDAGVKLAGQISKGEQQQSNTLATAGQIAMRMRMYPEAHTFLVAGAAGQPNASAMAGLGEMLKTVRRHEQIKWDDNNPARFAIHAAVIAFDGRHDWHKLAPYMAQPLRDMPGDHLERYIKRHWNLPAIEGLPPLVLIDMVSEMVKSSAEGDDASGYRVAIQFPGMKTQYVYLIKENGAFKILGESDELYGLGQEALNRIARKDVKGARVLLDWTRDELKLPGGEDPYAGHPFPHLWNKGQDADEGRMRVAAAMLLVSTPNAMKPYIAQIAGERDKATSDSEKQKLSLALLAAQYNARDWAGAEEVGRKMLEKESSPRVLTIVAESMRRQKKWSAVAPLVESIRSKLPEEMAAPRELARTLEAQHDPAGAMKIMKPFVENGKATPSDVNNYGWMAVMAGDISPDVLRVVQQTVQQPANRNYAIVHTLACMYAEAGQVKQAQQTLLDAMKLDLLGQEDTVWYGYARLAENYGEYEAAAKLYRKVSKPEFFDDEPSATYALSQNRLLLVGGKQGTAAAK